MSEDQTGLVVDDVEYVEVQTIFSNNEEDAFNAFVSFSIPRSVFNFDQVSVETVRVTCVETSPPDSPYDNRTCNVRTPLSTSAGNIPLVIRLGVVTSLIGNEADAMVPISIAIGRNSTRNTEDVALLSNNEITVEIPIGARSVFTVSGLVLIYW